MPKIGAHVSAANSLAKSFEKARKIGAECTQIFISPPQQWAPVNHSEEAISYYLKTQKESGIGPNFIHAAYLINLASSNPFILSQSKKWLINSLITAEKLHVEGTIFHIGSSKERSREEAINQVKQIVSEILENSKESKLIIETSAGAGNTIGDDFEEIGAIVKSIQDPRLKVAFDTQHIFASGYDVRTKEGVEKVLTEFDKKVGLDKLVAIHINDSKTELNSHKDRHENIGEGLIGLEGFAYIINNSRLKDIPFILETPGFDNEGPDRKNIEILKSLINLFNPITSPRLPKI